MIQNFYEKYIKVNCFKTNDVIKNVDTLLFLLLLTTGQREKNIEKTFVSAGAQKRRKTAVSGSALPQYLPNPKSKFPVKLIFT